MYASTSSRRSSRSAAPPSPRQRPQLLRSSATRASVTPSNEVHASLVSPNSPHTAADLLNKVASPLSSCDISHHHHHIVSPAPSEAITIDQSIHDRSPSNTELSTPESHVSGYYFSFPNFDNWESPKEESEEPC